MWRNIINSNALDTTKIRPNYFFKCNTSVTRQKYLKVLLSTSETFAKVKAKLLSKRLSVGTYFACYSPRMEATFKRPHQYNARNLSIQINIRYVTSLIYLYCPHNCVLSVLKLPMLRVCIITFLHSTTAQYL
jgi:hypothetical protein